MTCTRTLWVCGALAGLMAISASAQPPTYANHNRTYGNWVDGGHCMDIEGGFRCRSVQVSENYDVKGTYEYTEASYSFWVYRYDPADGSFRDGWRTLTCPVDQKSISAHPNRVTIDVSVDRDGLGCYQWGYLYTWDPVNGYQWSPWEFGPGTIEIEGEWIDPFSFGSAISNHNDKFYDGWSDTTHNTVNHCKMNWGDMMTRGGFATTSEQFGTRFWAFEGPDGPSWSFYHVSSCNDNQSQH